MIYLKAFVLGGGFCLATQFLFFVTKRSIPTILTLTFCAGILLTASGLMDFLTSFGQSGMFLTLYGAGEAAYRGMVSLLDGEPSGILRYCGLILYCFVLGIGLGYALHRKHKAEA